MRCFQTGIGWEPSLWHNTNSNPAATLPDSPDVKYLVLYLAQ